MSEQHDEPIQVEGLPQEEEVDAADVADRVDLDPDEQENREDVDEANTPDAPADDPDS